MRIGDLAKASGLSRDTLRFYETRGLIVARRGANGYRDYPVETVELLGLIRTAQHLGFSLGDIAAHLKALWQADDPAPAVQALLQRQLALLDERIDAMTRLREELRRRLTTACPLNPLQGTTP